MDGSKHHLAYWQSKIEEAWDSSKVGVAWAGGGNENERVCGEEGGGRRKESGEVRRYRILVQSESCK